MRQRRQVRSIPAVCACPTTFQVSPISVSLRLPVTSVSRVHSLMLLNVLSRTTSARFCAGLRCHSAGNVASSASSSRYTSTATSSLQAAQTPQADLNDAPITSSTDSDNSVSAHESESSTAQSNTPKYVVPRNTKGKLPVYTDIRNGGTRKLLLIRNVEGDAVVSLHVDTSISSIPRPIFHSSQSRERCVTRCLAIIKKSSKNCNSPFILHFDAFLNATYPTVHPL